MLDINDIIYLIFALSIFTVLIVIITSIIIKSRQNKNANALKELTNSVAEIKTLVASISARQEDNAKVISELKETLNQHVSEETEAAVVMEIAEEPIVKEEIKEPVVENSASRTVELASKIAEYATQIEQLNEITDPQIRDLKKQLLIFELQEIKREIALIEG